jgi:hypothetical protein
MGRDAIGKASRDKALYRYPGQLIIKSLDPLGNHTCLLWPALLISPRRPLPYFFPVWTTSLTV